MLLGLLNFFQPSLNMVGWVLPIWECQCFFLTNTRRSVLPARTGRCLFTETTSDIVIIIIFNILIKKLTLIGREFEMYTKNAKKLGWSKISTPSRYWTNKLNLKFLRSLNLVWFELTCWPILWMKACSLCGSLPSIDLKYSLQINAHWQRGCFSSFDWWHHFLASTDLDLMAVSFAHDLLINDIVTFQWSDSFWH